MEDNEEHFSTVIREIKEETGIDIGRRAVKLIFAHTQISHDQSIVRLLFAAKVKQPAVHLSEEHDVLRWVPVAEAAQALDHPVWSKGLDYALNHNLLPSAA